MVQPLEQIVPLELLKVFDALLFLVFIVEFKIVYSSLIRNFNLTIMSALSLNKLRTLTNCFFYLSEKFHFLLTNFNNFPVLALL